MFQSKIVYKFNEKKKNSIHSIHMRMKSKQKYNIIIKPNKYLI